MQKDVLKNLDLKVVAIIGDLFTSRSVSTTAANLSIRQSTVSMALARLRKHFDDPLFVRTSAGMEPTPKGSELIEVLKSAEFYLRKALEHRVAFPVQRLRPRVPGLLDGHCATYSASYPAEEAEANQSGRHGHVVQHLRPDTLSAGIGRSGLGGGIPYIPGLGVLRAAVVSGPVCLCVAGRSSAHREKPDHQPV